MDADGNPTTPAEHVVAELSEAARRYRDGQVERHGDYSTGAADAYDDAADVVSKALTTGPDLGQLLGDDTETWYMLGASLTCSEADQLVELFRAIGRGDHADALTTGHAEGDEEGDDHYQVEVPS